MIFNDYDDDNNNNNNNITSQHGATFKKISIQRYIYAK